MAAAMEQGVDLWHVAVAVASNGLTQRRMTMARNVHGSAVTAVAIAVTAVVFASAHCCCDGSHCSIAGCSWSVMVA